jgi:hypothetical protein
MTSGLDGGGGRRDVVRPRLFRLFRLFRLGADFDELRR